MLEFFYWDINTLTANDFTVEIEIKEKFWKDFCEKYPIVSQK